MDPLHLLLLLAALTLPAGEAAHTEMTSVWAVSGGRAELPCPPAPRLPEDEPLLVLWYRSSNTLPVYSYDARVGDFDAGDHWVDQQVLGERALFTTLSNPPTLVLESTLASDQGLYTCRVDYRLSPSTTNTVNLTVVMPPGPPVVLWGGVSVVGQLGPLTENTRVRVICRSVGGRPSPMVTWWWRGSRLPNQVTTSSTHPTTGGRRVEATLVVVASREMQGAILTCHAQTPTPHHAHHTALLQPRSASVTLNVTLPPLEVRILGSGGPVSAGATLQLVCRTVGSHPPAELTWWRGHSRLTHVSYAFDGGGNVTTATLTVVVERDHDGATLACTAANPLLPHAPLTDSIKLKVFYTPVVRLSLGRHLTAGLIKEGDDVFFECTIRANPTVHRVDWYHSGVPVVHNVTGGIVVSGLSLVVRRLRRRHSGFYTCAAANMEGWNTSNAIQLTVRHSPVCAGDVWERTQGAARGEPAVVVCSVEAVPAQGVTWAWMRVSEDGRERPIAEEDVRSEGLTSSVVVTPLTPEDYGQVSCRATNSVGRQRRPCLVRLVPAGPPDPLTNCSADPAAHTEAYKDPLAWSLAVTCHEGFDGGLPQEFILEAWQDHVLVANMSSDFPEWAVCLRGGVATTLIMTASNARGRSDAHRLEMQTAGSVPEPETAALGVPTMLGAIVGLVSVLLLLLVLSVVIARHAGPCRAKGNNHEHKLVVTATGSAWECYDPDLVSSAQHRHPSLDVLANACGRRESLAHTQTNAHAPAQPQTKTMVHIHSQTTPLMNGRIVKCQEELQADNVCQECDCSSYSSCDSDVESVVEVIDLTAAGRSAAPRQPGGDDRLARAATAAGDPGRPSPGVVLSPGQVYPGDSHPHARDSDTSCLPPTQDTVGSPTATRGLGVAQRVKALPKNREGAKNTLKICGTGKLVRFSNDRKAEVTSECAAPKKAGKSEPWAAAPPVAPVQEVPAGPSREKNKKPETTPPPPKPPRAFSHADVSSDAALPTPSFPSGLPPPALTPETENPGSGGSYTERAPLAEDEVRDAYCSVQTKAARPWSTTAPSNPAIRESTI